MLEKVGIIISGCKQSYGVICSNKVVNEYDADIAKTLTDIRKHFSFHKAYVDFFSVELIKEYKVYTGYRSSKDFGRDAYMAVSLYVPHWAKIPNVRNLLKDLLDCYFRNYMNPLTGESLNKKREDIRLFESIIQKYQLTDDEPQSLRTSRRETQPVLFIYDDEAELAEYFECPYQPSVSLGQKVFLLSKAIYDHPDESQLEFAASPFMFSDDAPELEVEHEGDVVEEETKDEEDVAEIEEIEIPISNDENQDIDSPSEPSNNKKLGIAILAAAVVLIGIIVFALSKSEKSYLEETVSVDTIASQIEKTNADTVELVTVMQVTNQSFTSPVKGGMGTYQYTGPVDDQGRPDGTGKAVFSNGDYYEGPFVQGVMTGEGAQYNYKNGAHFKGEMRNDQFFKGTYTHADGRYFTGSFNLWKPRHGTWYDKDGKKMSTI